MVSRRSPDHPRSRGVYSAPTETYLAPHGSSPLARGLQLRRELFRSRLRIIPARAGFTPPSPASRRRFEDHPRSRGVYSPPVTPATAGSGSSPLARGLQPERPRTPGPGGIIPARAGFTATSSIACGPQEDHPRSRGVYWCAAVRFSVDGGSSPLARGLPRKLAEKRPLSRIIPARAGFTVRT